MEIFREVIQYLVDTGMAYEDAIDLLYADTETDNGIPDEYEDLKETEEALMHWLHQGLVRGV